MGNRAKTVIWIGAFLVVMQLVAAWPLIRKTIFSSSPTVTAKSSSPGFKQPTPVI